MHKLSTDPVEIAARPYYIDQGNNSWKHVQQVLTHARDIAKNTLNRDLTRNELAAILFHDSAVKEYGKEDHGIKGGDNAVKELKKLKFNKADIADIKRAIQQHDEFKDTYGKWDSITGEVLAAGDANPPDLNWILNKSYVYGIRKNLAHKDRLANTIKVIPEKYGENGYFYEHAPSLYLKYHKDKISDLKKALSLLKDNKSMLWRRIKKYRAAHSLIGDDVTLPDPEY